MRVKSGNKKSIHNKKIIHTKVDEQYRDINQKITKLASDVREGKGTLQVEEDMTFDEVRKLLTKNDVKKDKLRISLDDKMYLEPLLKKYGQNFEAMMADVKLNKMQWNANQIKKKHEQYLKFLSETQN